MDTIRYSYKYLLALLVVLAIIDLNNAFVPYLAADQHRHIMLGYVLLALGCIPFLRLKWLVPGSPSLNEPLRKWPWSRPANPVKDDSYGRLILKFALLFLFRAALILTALAYIANAIAVADPSFVRSEGAPVFGSFIVLVLRHTIAPLADLLEGMIPAWPIVALAKFSAWKVLFLATTSVSFSVLVVGGLLIGFTAGRERQRLQRAVHTLEAWQAEVVPAQGARASG